MRRNFEFETFEDGSARMTEKNTLYICEQEGQYEYPELNTKLYLHYKTYSKIENLDNFKNVTTLFLENNLIKKIENLECLPNLTNLYLQNNLIKKIEGLEKNVKLVNVNLAKNQINVIENLQQCKLLKNIDLSENYVKKSDDMEELTKLESLSTINLTSNFLEYDDNLLPLLTKIPELLVLYLNDNPCQRHFKSYRKQIIGSIEKLTYLDDRPVTIEDRKLSEAWVNGGMEQLRKVRDQMGQEKKDERERDREISRVNSYRKKKLRVNYFQYSLKTCILNQSKLEKQLKVAKYQNDQVAIEFYSESLVKAKQTQQDIEESLQNLKIQIKRLEDNSQQTVIDDSDQVKIVISEQEILLMLESLAQKHKEDKEKIYEEFEDIVKYMKENLDSEIDEKYRETEYLSQNIDQILQQQEQDRESDSNFNTSDSQSQNSSSLQQYDTSDADSDLQNIKIQEQEQQNNELDDLD